MRFRHDNKEEQSGDRPVISPATDAWQPLSDGLAWLRGVCVRREIPTIREDTEMVMRRILEEAQPARILEVGTAIGYSACMMAELSQMAWPYRETMTFSPLPVLACWYRAAAQPPAREQAVP